MPTRAATAAAASTNMRTTRSSKLSSSSTTISSGKENGTRTISLLPSSTKGKEKAAVLPKKAVRNVKSKAKKVEEELFCSCRGVDDGTPMVQCGTCDDWYHFRCIELSEDDASEIKVYVCPSCQEKTGRRTVIVLFRLVTTHTPCSSRYILAPVRCHVSVSPHELRTGASCIYRV
ncbi:hypothetical protein BGW80DRAFT_241155 [Lactifluus volemus]|nr:hypothetical protein BGW80DRAFT_241155 [Lactifluus volemus]